MKSLMVLMALTLSTLAHASVWTANRLWDDQMENLFSLWVSGQISQINYTDGSFTKLTPLSRTVFTDPKSPYYGAKLDCADVSYAFRAIFAKEVGLPFSTKNPVATSTSKLQRFHNEMSKWGKYNFDAMTDGNARMVAFLNMLGDSLGTETLAANDSFPVFMNGIRTGDFFMFKIKSQITAEDGTVTQGFIRHTYNLRKIDDYGDFWVYYGTQAKKASGAPLGGREHAEESKNIVTLRHRPDKYKWGFRRYGHHSSETDTKTFVVQSSDEQYTKAREVKNDADFFEAIKSKIRKKEKIAENILVDKLNELCNGANKRIEAVKDGVKAAKALNGACMEYTDYDSYSTPNMDRDLKVTIGELEASWKKYHKDATVTANTRSLLSAFADASAVDADKTLLLDFCPINFDADKKLSLRVLRLRFQSKSVSFNPNDSMEARWGEKNGARRPDCKVFYQ